MTKSTREDKLEACSTSFDEDIRFFFQDLPRIFRAKHEAAMKELEKAIAEMKPKIRKERLAHEKAHREAFGQFLSTLEEHLKAWVNGTGPQDSRRFGALAQETCQQLSEANQEALQKDSDFRRVEDWLDGALESIAKQFAKKETAFADDVYRQVALQLREKHSKNQAFRQKPYEVKLRDGEIVAPPVSLARDDGAWIGDNWIGPQPTATQEMFPPPEDAKFPVGIVHPYQTPGWLTYGPKGLSAKKASAVLSNVLFQRLLSGLPNIKVAVFDSECSDIKDYEYDLTQNLPPDLEKSHGKLLVKCRDFSEFKSCTEKWMVGQPENFKRSKQNKASNKRLFQLYAILVLSDSSTEYEAKSSLEWMTWWIRQIPRGVGLFVVSSDKVYKAVGGDNNGFVHLTLDNSGQNLVFGEGGELWTVKETTVSPSWAANIEDWNMGLQVLQKLIRPPEKELPGVVNVRFADEENGEVFCLRYDSSTKANTIFIHGQQGSGKSVALMSFIMRAAKKYSPEELTFYIFDFKNTFSPFRNLKHVACLTLSKNEQIMLGVLGDINAQREERQALFDRVAKKYRITCENLDHYNRFRAEHPKEGLAPLPRILVVVDECKNMLRPDKETKKIEELLDKYLLSQGRSAGIHFLFATTEDIRSDVGKAKFDAMLQLSRVHEKFIATLSEGENERKLVMPTIAEAEIMHRYDAIDEINLLYKDCSPVISPLFFGEHNRGVDAEEYPPFVAEIRKMSVSAAHCFQCSSGIDAGNLRQLHVVPFRQGQSGQGLSIFGRWNSPCFKGGMELFLRTLESAARRGDISVDILDVGNRWEGNTDGCNGHFNVWRDAKSFLEVKRAWLRTANGLNDGPRVLVAFDAEDTLQGEERMAQQTMTPKGAKLNSKKKISSEAALNAALADIWGESQEKTELSEQLPADEVDRLFRDAAFLKLASKQGAFLVAVTEKPPSFSNSVVEPDRFGRFLVYSTAKDLSGLENSLAENMGYYVESPGEAPHYFLPLAEAGIAKAILETAKPQKGADRT